MMNQEQLAAKCVHKEFRREIEALRNYGPTEWCADDKLHDRTLTVAGETYHFICEKTYLRGRNKRRHVHFERYCVVASTGERIPLKILIHALAFYENRWLRGVPAAEAKVTTP